MGEAIIDAARSCYSLKPLRCEHAGMGEVMSGD